MKKLKRKVTCVKCGEKYTDFIGVTDRDMEKYACTKCYTIFTKEPYEN